MNLLKILIYLNLFFKFILLFKMDIKSSTATIFNLSICSLNNKLC